MLQGGERIERAYWACVVAKVPIREQLKLYQDALEKARAPIPPAISLAMSAFMSKGPKFSQAKELAWAAVPLYDGQRQSMPKANH